MRALEHETDERSLIEAAQRDPVHFAELYENNFDRVYGFLARRVGNRDEAQDLTAEVFHQALAGLARFQWRGAPFATWLLGIAANVLADRWQHLAKQQEVAADDGHGGAEPAGIADEAEKRAMLSQLVDDFRSRIKSAHRQPRFATLTAREKEILKFLAEGESVKEIAAGLNLSVKTVEAHKFNLMRKLDIHNKAHLVQYAIQKKIIKIPVGP